MSCPEEDVDDFHPPSTSTSSLISYKLACFELVCIECRGSPNRSQADNNRTQLYKQGHHASAANQLEFAIGRVLLLPRAGLRLRCNTDGPISQNYW